MASLFDVECTAYAGRMLLELTVPSPRVPGIESQSGVREAVFEENSRLRPNVYPFVLADLGALANRVPRCPVFRPN
jgi:hypothetical protein